MMYPPPKQNGSRTHMRDPYLTYVRELTERVLSRGR